MQEIDTFSCILMHLFAFLINYKTMTYSYLHRFIVFSSGERGIRTPGPLTVNGFQDRRIRPLCHLSVGKIR